MRTILFLLTLALAVVAFAAGDGMIVGKQHDYDSDKLPEVIKVTAGDSIVVMFKIKPQDVDSLQVDSDNGDVTIKKVSGKDDIQIVFQSDKKGKAKVSWTIDLITGISKVQKGQQIEFE